MYDTTSPKFLLKSAAVVRFRITISAKEKLRLTTGGYVDEETQRNDLAIVKLVAEVNDVVPIQKAYDFSFVRQAEQQLKKAGWKP